MFIWASLARHAKHASLLRVCLLFLAVQCLLAIPIGISLLRTEPADFYPRIHGGPDFGRFDRTWARWVSVAADENGFVSSVAAPPGASWPAAFDTYDAARGTVSRVIIAPGFDGWADEGVLAHAHLFAVTPEYIFYRDANALLAVPTRLVPAWALQEMDHRELFNHLALYNRYFSGIVAPVFVLIFFVLLISQALIYAAAIWLFGHWRKLTGAMTVRERFSVCAFASVPAGLAGLAFGIILPVVHIFIAQLIMIYIAYKAMKEF